MNKKRDYIPVIDLFAGPGGLGEGFSSYRDANSCNPFSIGLSIEADSSAHKTLQLRALSRILRDTDAYDDYLLFMQGEISYEQILSRNQKAAMEASREAWCAELGSPDLDTNELRHRIKNAIGKSSDWVLIGGPPCQAYSMIGRSRNRGVKGYRPEDDHRHYLYQEYLKVLAEHCPSVFVMENVKGILSSQVKGNRLFDQITRDLKDPAKAAAKGRRPSIGPKYRLFALTDGIDDPDTGARLFNECENPRDFVIRCERFGVPQARHRVIVVGVRSDISRKPRKLRAHQSWTTVRDVISDLPRLRAGLSKELDDGQTWKHVIKGATKSAWFRQLTRKDDVGVVEKIDGVLSKMRIPRAGRGAEHMMAKHLPRASADWYRDGAGTGVMNSTTRAHIAEDLHRYLFCAAYASVTGRSPTLKEFPSRLLPNHLSARPAERGSGFHDRFRVQLWGRPSTTVVSHISKDGHYYIHPDPSQCRSLTVREAARLQTFPDSYVFLGGRTQQYCQVGNAVPPKLAQQIASIVHELIIGLDEQKDDRSYLDETAQREYVEDSRKGHAARAESPVLST